MRATAGVGGRQAGYPLANEKGRLLGAHDRRLYPHRGGYLAATASRTLGATSGAKRRIFSRASSWLTPGRRPQKQKWS